MEKKLIIIGSGPAALTAAIYAARANLEPLMYEGFMSGPVGGQLMTTTVVENFPGFPEGILGAELMEKMRQQALRFGTVILTEDVTSVDFSQTPFVVNGTKNKATGHAVIVATGAFAKRLDIPGARDGEFWQKGVSSCAVCDGAAPIFRGKEIFVVGGGDSAMEEALFLTKFASKVYIVHRKDSFKASKIMLERAQKNNKIVFLLNQEVVTVLGDKVVNGLVLKDVNTKKEEKRAAAGLFFAIGHQPNSVFLKEQLEMTENGYIITKKGSCATSKEGVFAAGDVQDYIYRQAITAAGSGCMAALEAEKWLSHRGVI